MPPASEYRRASPSSRCTRRARVDQILPIQHDRQGQRPVSPISWKQEALSTRSNGEGPGNRLRRSEQAFRFSGQSRRIDAVISADIKEFASRLWPPHYCSAKATARDLMASARQPPRLRVERLDVCLQVPGVVRNKRDRPAIWCKDCEPLPPRADQQWNQLTFPCQINQVDVWVLPAAGVGARSAGLRDEPAVRG